MGESKLKMKTYMIIASVFKMIRLITIRKKFMDNSIGKILQKFYFTAISMKWRIYQHRLCKIYDESILKSTHRIGFYAELINQRTNGPVNAHLISWPTKAQNIQNLENIW